MDNKIKEIEKSIELLQQSKHEIIQADDHARKAAKEKQIKQNNAELDALVAEYNQVEGEQGQRLTQIFDLLKQRSGYRRVTFANSEQWVNCWDKPKRLDAGLYIRRLDRSITEIQPGG